VEKLQVDGRETQRMIVYEGKGQVHCCNWLRVCT
jgi:hypothetical protein